MLARPGMTRRELIIAAAGVALGAASAGTRVLAESSSVNRALERGIDWLLRQQGEDGGWHSETYGAMRGGAGITALAVAALAPLESRDTRIPTALSRGLRFLTAHADVSGLIRPADAVADFPVLATAFTLIAVARDPDLISLEVRQRLCQGLERAQRSQFHGWELSHPDFGGWGMTVDGTPPQDPPSPSNVSVTASVLAALQLHRELTQQIRDDALVFLDRCQCPASSDDDAGGLGFTTRPDDPLNKAGFRTTHDGSPVVRPYPTPTCDGLVAFRACGLARDDARITAALTWLERNSVLAPTDLPSFRSGLTFYEAMAWVQASHTVESIGLVAIRNRHQQRLVESQMSEGSWKNPRPSMREDDPLIATGLALRALTDFSALVSQKPTR